ncbi:MAG: NUDIX domain-containing protein [Candidatus Saccharimonas sp.]
MAVYSDNGSPIEDKARDRGAFQNDPSLIMANSHIWLWKKSEDGKVEILLQQRSFSRSLSPGKFSISAAGHINVGESALQTAIRETKEEVGLGVDPDKLHFSYSTRIIGRAPNSIASVYLYELNGSEEFTYLDGEVEGC